LAYAQTDDVEVRLGRGELSPEETALVATRLGDVERMILKRIPDLAAKITAGDIDVEDVIYVEAEVVLRVVRNPDGYTQETDGNYTYIMSGEAASAKLKILPEEWSMLGLAPTGARVFVIRPKLNLPWQTG
jgi:hypothetical protein